MFLHISAEVESVTPNGDSQCLIGFRDSSLTAAVNVSAKEFLELRQQQNEFTVDGWLPVKELRFSDLRTIKAPREISQVAVAIDPDEVQTVSPINNDTSCVVRLKNSANPVVVNTTFGDFMTKWREARSLTLTVNNGTPLHFNNRKSISAYGRNASSTGSEVYAVGDSEPFKVKETPEQIQAALSKWIIL